MVTMNIMEAVQRPFITADQLIQEVSDSFEQHFLWLEEVVAEARQTLTSSDLQLLPKTPSAAPKRTQRHIKEDAENLPPPAGSQTNRRGRLCSKLAFEKIQEQGRLDRVKKLRRPSSNVSQVPPSTAHKSTRFQIPPSPSRCAEEQGDSPVPKCRDVSPATPRSSCKSLKQRSKSTWSPREASHTPHKDDSPQKTSPALPHKNNTTFSQEDPITTQKSDCEKEENLSAKDLKKKSYPREDVCESPGSSIPQKDSIISHKNSKQKRMLEISVHGEDITDGPQDSPKTAAAAAPQASQQEEEEFCLQLDESFDESPKEEEDIEMVCEVPKKRDSNKSITQASTLDREISNTKQMKENGGSPSTLTHPPSIQDKEVLCSKQDAIEVHNISSSSPFVPISCSVPLSRVAASQQKTVESPEAPQSPAVPAPRVTRTKQKVLKAQEFPPVSEILPQPSVAPASRVTRTKQRAIETQDVAVPQESQPQSVFAPAPRVTRTKQKAMEREMPPSSPVLPQPAPRITRTKQKAKEVEPPCSPQESSSQNDVSADEDEETASRGTQGKPDQHTQGSDEKCMKYSSVKDSGVYSLGVRQEGWESAESVSSGDTCAVPTQPSTPPMRVTRSKMSKPQPARRSPEKVASATQSFQRNHYSPRGAMNAQSPRRDSPTTRRLAAHSDRDGGIDHLASEVLHSPVRVIRHSPDKFGKVVLPRLPAIVGSSGRVTPSLASRMQSLISSSSSSSSASAEHRKIFKRIVGTPAENRRPANIVTGVTSFIKSQPARPTREDVEKLRIQELQRKKELEEEILKKKEQLLIAKTEERKRCNEERMRRAKEARLKRDQMAAAAKEQQQRERQQREARQREEEEQQRHVRQQLLAKKKAEEAKKAAKLREEEEKRRQEEEEKKRKKLEEEKRRQRLEEENRKRLEEERRNYLAEQRNVLEEQRKAKLAKTHMLMKEKEDAEQLRLKESLRILREKELQAKREQEAKTVMSSTYIYKEHASSKETNSGPLNTTYTMPEASGGSAKTDSYEMTPMQPKRTSNSLNNYDINDIQSDDSTDDDSSPKKKIPQWAMKTQMMAALLQQEHYPPKMDNIFPASSLLILPDLSQIFQKQKRRFRKRTSSAVWETPPSKFFRVKSPM